MKGSYLGPSFSDAGDRIVPAGGRCGIHAARPGSS
jgi:hypothetical protein